jgi:2-phospho-L-lactate guanylyltransferase
LTAAADTWAVIPVKETAGAKQRLGDAVPAHLRTGFVLTMLEDVLCAVTQAHGLAGIAVVTVDEAAGALARRYGARILTEAARDGHTAAIAAAARTLSAEGRTGMLQLPGDVPLVTAEEISTVLAGHAGSPAFTIVPSHDEFGSNTVLVSPPTAVPLSFGDDSFFPHLRTARACGIEPLVLRLPGIGRDIDHTEDIAVLARTGSATRTQAFLDRHGYPGWDQKPAAAAVVRDGAT